MIAKKEARKAELASKTIEEQAEMMSIRERLEHELETTAIEIPMKDKIGDFKLRFKKLSTKQFDDFNRIQRSFNKEKATADKLQLDKQFTDELRGQFEQKEKDHSEYLYNLFESQSLDNLTADFWRNGEEYSPGLISVVLDTILKESISIERYMADIHKFRQK
jgi:hypothetical protein